MPGEPLPEGGQGIGEEKCVEDGLVVGGEPDWEIDVEIRGGARKIRCFMCKSDTWGTRGRSGPVIGAFDFVL